MRRHGESYFNRAMKSRDLRYRNVLEKLGYGGVAEQPVGPVRTVGKPEPQDEAEPTTQVQHEPGDTPAYSTRQLISRSELRRYNKAELAEFLRSHGEDADEDDTSRDALLDRALSVQEDLASDQE